jgi:hypothetical protein
VPAAVPSTVACTDTLDASSVTAALSPVRVHLLSAVRASVNPPPLLATIGTPLTLAPPLPVIVVTSYSPTGQVPAAGPGNVGSDPEVLPAVVGVVVVVDDAALLLLSEHALSRANSPTADAERTLIPIDDLPRSDVLPEHRRSSRAR